LSKAKTRPFIKFRVTGSPVVSNVVGQEARTLAALIAAGPSGVTAQDLSSWALRLAHYIMQIKRRGVAIEMSRELHGGNAPGWHGLYTLKCQIEVIETNMTDKPRLAVAA
jgi:hypothetical protein